MLLALAAHAQTLPGPVSGIAVWLQIGQLQEKDKV
jgi:hypothetical protein